MRSVNLGRWSRRVERYFNMKGGGGLQDVDPSVRVILPIASGGEERYLEAWQLFGAGAIQTAVAGNFSAVNIRNPLNSNVVVVIEKLTTVTGTASQIDLLVAGAPNSADLAGAVTGHLRADARMQAGSTAVVTRDAPVADPETGYLTISNIFQTLNTPYDWILMPVQEIVLTPGISLRVVDRLVNTLFYTTIFWRERALEASELT